MKRIRDSEDSGSMILETSLVLPIFLFVFLFIYGYFLIVTAQNEITHALLQSADSMALDAYLTEHMDSAAESDSLPSGLGSLITDLRRSSVDDHFSSRSNWYSTGGDAGIARNRFVGYMAGGDEGNCSEKLKAIGVAGGLDGIEFSVSIQGDDLSLTAEYELQTWFDAFGLGKIPMSQTVVAKLWK